jgi:hypothetical protein
MNHTPLTIDGATVDRVASLSATPSLGRTRHIVKGEEVREFACLAIAHYPDAPGFYLFYCDENWHVVTDTFHDTLEGAISQAEFEFGAISFVDATSKT